jgi:hypothetical protein
MTWQSAPSKDHERFDAICAQIGEWDPLPSINTEPAPEAHELDEEQQAAPLDQLIFAGLVSP